jgi:hypothetical protein
VPKPLGNLSARFSRARDSAEKKTRRNLMGQGRSPSSVGGGGILLSFNPSPGRLGSVHNGQIIHETEAETSSVAWLPHRRFDTRQGKRRSSNLREEKPQASQASGFGNRVSGFGALPRADPPGTARGKAADLSGIGIRELGFGIRRVAASRSAGHREGKSLRPPKSEVCATRLRHRPRRTLRATLSPLRKTAVQN